MTTPKTTEAGERTQCKCGVETNLLGRAIDGSLHPGKACKQRTQHTPGPWGICTNTLSDLDIAADNGEGDMVCDLTNCLNAEANARLIAAAPELLEAIKKFIAFGKNEGDTTWHSPAAQSFFYDMMRAAGKAEWRS